MATSIPAINPAFPEARDRRPKRGLAFAIATSAVAGALVAAPACAGQMGNVDIVTRADGRTLSVYEKDGRRWILGTPGQEYGIRVCNTTPARVLAVMSVDGVNVVSGETAAPSQAGYVLDAWECTEINGWRKSLSSIAAFYFTELPDSHAARTGRPDNVGVIGVAFFRERQQPVAWKDTPGRIAPQSSAAEPSARQEAASDNAAAGGRYDAEQKRSSGFAAAPPAPAPVAKIGTGHGRNERSVVQTTRFERESASPNETIVFQYDRRENLIAMGILPPPAVARSSNPFPAWARAPYFVPDPPQR